MDKKYIHGSLAVDGNILQEFKDKFSALQRRLKSNQFNPDGYELMNDRQQDVFITGIFVDPMQAEGIDNYIEFGYDNCECPDVMDELYETCPALMSKVDKFKDRKDAQTRVTLEAPEFLAVEFLDRMMDMIIQEQLTKKTLITEASETVKAYEDKVYNACKGAGILGPWSKSQKGASPDATGPDVSFELPGLAEALLEVKLNMSAGMGEGSATYKPDKGEFTIPGEKMDPESKLEIINLLKDNEDAIKEFVKALQDPIHPTSYRWNSKLPGGDADKEALPFNTTKRAYDAAVKSGLYKAAARWPSAGTPAIKLPDNFIHNLYGGKGVNEIKSTDYIQIGGAGLYYMKNNPLKLPVTQLPSDAILIYRPKPSSQDKHKVTKSQAAARKAQKLPALKKGDFMPGDKEGYLADQPGDEGKPTTQVGKVKIGDYLYKGSEDEVQRRLRQLDAKMDKGREVRDEDEMIPEVYATYGGTMMIQAKFPGKKSKKNPEGFELPEAAYTMDQTFGPRGIVAMMKKMVADGNLKALPPGVEKVAAKDEQAAIKAAEEAEKAKAAKKKK